MKLLVCRYCHDMFAMRNKYARFCSCGKSAGKYLDDDITAVYNKNAVVFGIDNLGFGIALALRNDDVTKYPKVRVDRFFTGWIPNHPGEVIIVNTIQEVLDYPYEMKDEDKEYTSTSPTVLSEENEKKGIV